MHEVLVNRLGGISLPGKSVARLTDRPNMTAAIYRGRKTTTPVHSYSESRPERFPMITALIKIMFYKKCAQ